MGSFRAITRLVAIVALCVLTLVPNVTLARPPRPVAENCLGSGYLSLTSVRGTASTFRSERECINWAKRGNPLYPVPTAAWSEAIETSTDWEGTVSTWCDTVFTARNLDPKKGYSISFDASTVSTSFTLTGTYPIPVDSTGTGVYMIPWEECSGRPYRVYGDLLDANGQILASVGPVLLFTLS